MIKNIAIATVAAGILAAPAAFAIQPSAVPEVGTLENAPAGSTFTVDSKDNFGHKYENFFRVGADGQAELIYQQSRGE